MTVPSQVNRSGPYLGNGVTTVFDYEFKIDDENHLKVIKRNAAGVESELTIYADYIVSDVGNPSGGQVATVVAPAAGETITLLRNVPFVQETDLENQGAYYAETVEAALDLAAMRDQQLQEQVSRAVRIPVSADPSALDSLIEDIIRLGDSADNIDTVANNVAAVNTVALNIADVQTVASISVDVSKVAAIDAYVVAAANNEADISTVAGISADVSTVAGIAGDVSTLAGISADVTTVAGIAGDVTTVAANVTDVKNFAAVYQAGLAADPATRADGSPLQEGDMYFNTTIGRVKIYKGSAWVLISDIGDAFSVRGTEPGTTGLAVLGAETAEDVREAADISADNTPYTPLPGYVRNVGDWMRERRSLTDFAPGAIPSDWSPVLQAAINEVLDAGGELLIPSGRYNLNSSVAIDVSATSGPPGPNRHRIKIRGQGAGSTVLYGQTNSMNIMQFIGNDALGSGSHAYTELSDFSFMGNSPSSRTATGLKLKDLSYLRLRNLSFHNLFVGLLNEGCLSSLFDNLIFSEGTRGIQADAGFSGPHSNIYIGCQFRQLTGLAYNGFTGMSGATFINPRVEGCGTHGDSNTGGMIFRMSGNQGEAGPTIIGGYIEVNAGGFDFSINEIASQRVNANFFGTIFNRVNASRHVVNNIVTTGEVDLTLGGCTFTSYNDYVPSSLRPYLNLSAQTRLRDFGNRYEDAVEAPILGQSLPYSGIVNGSLGAGVTGVLPNGWTCSQDSTGVFRVTHNLGHTDYAVTATVNSGNNNAVRRVAKQNNYFQVVVRSEADAQADDNFSFQLSVLKPRS